MYVILGNTETENDNSDCTQNDNSSEFTNTWTHEATKLFLELWSERKERFQDPTIKKKKLFNEMSIEMVKKNHNFTYSEIERKFRNMKRYFLKMKYNNSNKGRARQSWCFYEVLEDIFAADRNINPPALTGLRYSPPSPSEADYSEEPTITTSRFEIVEKDFMDTEMLPEDASAVDFIETLKHRRLRRPITNEHIKRIKKSENSATQEILKLEEARNMEIRELREAIVRNNGIQQERNNLLKILLEKL